MTDTDRTPSQASLFDALPVSEPRGFRYQEDFLSPAEEAGLIELAQALPLREMRYKSYTARRRVLSFGGQYDFDANRLRAAGDIIPALEPLRAKAAAWLGVAPTAFTQILLAEYRPGTPLGWHRDVPDFEDVVGVSLLSEAVLRFRPYRPGAPASRRVIKLALAPRSVYLLRGPARWDWQHSVAPTALLRYSITLRTAAGAGATRPA